MRSFASYLRILVVLAVVYFIAEVTLDVGDQLVILEYPILLLFLVFLLILMVAFEVVQESLNTLADSMMTPELLKAAEERKKIAREQFWGNRLWKFLIGRSNRTESELLVEDHNYDGIRELNNPLPPWWLYLFYLTIIFSAVYLVRYHLMDGPGQLDELQYDLDQAALDIEEYKKTAVDLIDASSVVLLNDEESLAEGKTLYDAQCAVCHRADGGGGIGPNLTDTYWILGNSIGEVYTTISEGGRPGKGMISWKSTLRPSEIQKVSSYILSLQGTHPADALAPEGEMRE